MREHLKYALKRVPGLRWGVQFVRDRLERARLNGRDAEDIFSEIYRTNFWGNSRSVSGPGSNLEQAAAVVRELPRVFRERGVRSVLDIPCGDFHWMRTVDLAGINYIGADIVADLVEANRAAFATEGVAFKRLNLLADDLPAADLAIVRDCFIHLSDADVFSAVANLRRSASEYLLTTSFTDCRTNRDIVTGQWRPINLCRPPFNWPEPLEWIVEVCTEPDGGFSDRSLGLWRIVDLPADP